MMLMQLSFISYFIRKYLTEELCAELNLFKYGKRGFDYVVEEVADEQGWREIRNNIADDCGVGSIPYIRVVELDPRDYSLHLEHVFDGRELESVYAKKTLKYINNLWKRKVTLTTKSKDGTDIVLTCDEK